MMMQQRKQSKERRWRRWEGKRCKKRKGNGSISPGQMLKSQTHVAFDAWQWLNTHKRSTSKGKGRDVERHISGFLVGTFQGRIFWLLGLFVRKNSQVHLQAKQTETSGYIVSESTGKMQCWIPQQYRREVRHRRGR